MVAASEPDSSALLPEDGVDPGIAIAIDIGGTFTDVVATGLGGIKAVKVPSRHGDPVAAVEAGVRAIAELARMEPAAVTRFVHGTTVATNAVLTRRGARVGLLATVGFEDVLEIGRQKRSRMYDLFQPTETPVFLAPKRRRIGIPGRIGPDGRILTPLDEAAVRDAIRKLVAEHEIEALAVCYLFSFCNPIHERRTGEIAADVAPGLPVSLSCDIDPVFREYERTCVTAFDAYVRPVMTGYVRRLAAGLARAGVTAPVEVMQSRGAVADAARVIERPVVSLLSGPAAGALGGSVAASRAGHPNAVTLDMGGTSADIAVISGGRTIATREGRIAGFPLRVQMVDVHTIGAGGGSIARLDAGGALKVGPESAEADPGPACYGRGGQSPTVTDASRALAAAALGLIAAGLGTIERAALGVLTVCNEAMAEAIRAVTVRRGIDPRQFALIALGGAGPVHAGRVARILGMHTVVVPLRPGVLAAEGLLHAPVEEERHTTFLRPAVEATIPALRATFEALGDDAARRLTTGTTPAVADQIRYAADMRYIGQSYELEVPLEPFAADPLGLALGGFDEVYRTTYGRAQPGAPVEFVNLRAIAVSRRPAPPVDPLPAMKQAPQAIGKRAVWFTADGATATPVYARDQLPADFAAEGPAIIHQADTTTVVYPGQTWRVDRSGALIMSWGMV